MTSVRLSMRAFRLRRQSGRAAMLFAHMGPEMHSRGVEPAEERLIGELEEGVAESTARAARRAGRDPERGRSGQLVPMTDAIETNLGRKPEQLSADAGYCLEANLEALESRKMDGYVATGRATRFGATRHESPGTVRLAHRAQVCACTVRS
jgi:hypothetical protein